MAGLGLIVTAAEAEARISARLATRQIVAPSDETGGEIASPVMIALLTAIRSKDSAPAISNRIHSGIGRFSRASVFVVSDVCIRVARVRDVWQLDLEAKRE
jgi:hypothetical protein